MKLGIVGNGGIVKTALNVLKDTDIIVSSLWCRNASVRKPIIWLALPIPPTAVSE